MNDDEPDEMAKPLGKLLRDARKARGFNQRDFVEVSGISKRTMVNAEKGLVNVRVETVYAYLLHTDLTFDEVWQAFLPPRHRTGEPI